MIIESYAFISNIYILPANLIALIILAFVRRRVALGILVALAVNFVIAIILGLFINVICFIPFFVK